MAASRISIGVMVAPWVERYIRMVADRAQRTQQLPLMDIVERVCMRGIRTEVQPWG